MFKFFSAVKCQDEKIMELFLQAFIHVLKPLLFFYFLQFWAFLLFIKNNRQLGYIYSIHCRLHSFRLFFLVSDIILYAVSSKQCCCSWWVHSNGTSLNHGNNSAFKTRADNCQPEHPGSDRSLQVLFTIQSSDRNFFNWLLCSNWMMIHTYQKFWRQ